MEQEVEAEAEVEAEVLGSGWPWRRAVRGSRSVVVYFLKNAIGVCIKAGFKKASSINDLFISEVKSREGWRPRGRGGRLSPPMKLHGKNILKCISNNVVSQKRSLKEFRMHCYAFVMLYLKDGPLKSWECIAMLFVMLYLRRSLKKEFRMYWSISLLNVCFKIFCRKYQTPRGRRRGGMRGRGRRGGRGRGWDF